MLKDRIYDVYGAKWYQILYLWLYNLCHKHKKRFTRKSLRQVLSEEILNDFKIGYTYPYINAEMKEMKEMIEELMKDVEE